MKQFRISFLVIVLSLMLTGMAFAVDIPNISTWTQSMGVGGDGPGLGDLLLAPLYDVRALNNPDTPEGCGLLTTQQTLIAIVNTDPDYGVIAHIRFREWKRSDEVLDFSIPLSRNDVWVAEVSRKTGGGAIINSSDRWISGAPTATSFPSAVFPTAGIAFLTSTITDGTAAEKLARTEYGYIEIIGEERVTPTMTAATGAWTRIDGPSPTYKDVQDTLMGHVYLIRPEAQVSHQYNMNAYSDFSVNTAGIWWTAFSGRPNLRLDVQGEGSNPGIGGFDQLEAIMSKRYINFQYVDGIDTATNTPMSTSVVITFPTKHFHYDTDFHRKLAAPTWAPFTGYHETLGDGTAGGEVFHSYIYDRSENYFQFPVSPGTLEILPYEVNIMGLLPVYPLPDPFARGWRDNLLLATQGASGLATDKYQSGWVSLDLSPTSEDVGLLIDSRSVAVSGAFGSGVAQGKSDITFNFMGTKFPTGAAAVLGWHFPGITPLGPCPVGGCLGQYRGLPAIGIVMTEFYNDSVEGYYGNSVPWQYEAAFGVLPTL